MTVLVGALASVTWQPAGSGTPILAVTLPDGTTLTPAPTSTGTPATATFETAQAGRHVLAWSLGTERHADILDVWPAAPRYLVSIDDALAAIASGGTVQPKHREELPLYIAAATPVIEDMTGPLLAEARSLRIHGGRAAVNLPALGVTVQSVTVDGTLLAEADYVVDGPAGILYFRSAPAAGLLNVDVAYRVGVVALAPDLRVAVLEQIRFMWQVTHSGNGKAAQALGYTPAGYAVPYLVQGLCESHPKAPGFS